MNSLYRSLFFPKNRGVKLPARGIWARSRLSLGAVLQLVPSRVASLLGGGGEVSAPAVVDAALQESVGKHALPRTEAFAALWTFYQTQEQRAVTLSLEGPSPEVAARILMQSPRHPI